MEWAGPFGVSHRLPSPEASDQMFCIFFCIQGEVGTRASSIDSGPGMAIRCPAGPAADANSPGFRRRSHYELNKVRRPRYSALKICCLFQSGRANPDDPVMREEQKNIGRSHFPSFWRCVCMAAAISN